MVEEKQDVDSRDNVLNTPLHYAAKAGHIEAVEWLLDHGADINALNANDDTPLHSVRHSSPHSASNPSKISPFNILLTI